MKKFFSNINQVIKASLPYTALLAVVLGIINLILISKAQSDIEYTYNKVDDVESAIQNINTDYDNSDVISNIRKAHNSIINHIDDAQRSLSSDIIIFGR